jgi:NADPH:quinone reductase-like Zn-dependent oxidoreductase
MYAARRALTPTGRYVMVGGPTRRFIAALALGPVVSALGRRRYRGFSLEPTPDDLRFLGDLLDSGAVTPVIDREYPLQRVPDAVRDLEAGRVTGKVVIRSEG